MLLVSLCLELVDVEEVELAAADRTDAESDRLRVAQHLIAHTATSGVFDAVAGGERLAVHDHAHSPLGDRDSAVRFDAGDILARTHDLDGSAGDVPDILPGIVLVADRNEERFRPGLTRIAVDAGLRLGHLDGDRLTLAVPNDEGGATRVQERIGQRRGVWCRIHERYSTGTRDSSQTANDTKQRTYENSLIFLINPLFSRTYKSLILKGLRISKKSVRP